MPSQAITMTKFDGFNRDLATGKHNLGTDVIKAMLVTSVPAASTATNAVLTEVTGANYTAGGINLSATLGGTDPQVILQSAVNTLWTENASGFTNAKAVVVRNETAGLLISFGDITPDGGTTPVSSAAQDVDVNWANGTDIHTIN